MKECDNSTRKIHISNNFILSISLLITFDTLLLRPSTQLQLNISYHNIFHAYYNKRPSYPHWVALIIFAGQYK